MHSTVCAHCIYHIILKKRLQHSAQHPPCNMLQHTQRVSSIVQHIPTTRPPRSILWLYHPSKTIRFAPLPLIPPPTLRATNTILHARILRTSHPSAILHAIPSALPTFTAYYNIPRARLLSKRGSTVSTEARSACCEREECQPRFYLPHTSRLMWARYARA